MEILGQERMDDLPLLAYYFRELGLAEQIDNNFPAHGNWQNPGLGKTCVIFLLYIISESKHDLYNVSDWVEERLETLRYLLDCPELDSRHLSDDRLEILLDKFSEDENFDNFNADHNSSILKVYKLKPQVIRLDSVKAQSFGKGNELLGKSHRQINKRSDLNVVKTMVACADPLALPTCSLIVNGSRVDDRLYIPVIEKCWNSGLDKEHLLYSGDSKMGNQENWRFIAMSNNYYINPLSVKQFSKLKLDESIDWIENNEEQVTPFYGYNFAQGEVPENEEAIANFIELPSVVKKDEESGFEWTHRLIAINNKDMRTKVLRNLEDRYSKSILEITERFVLKRGKKRLKSIDEAKMACDKITKRYRTSDMIEFTFSGSGSTTDPLQVQCEKIEKVYSNYERRAGWSVYGTNADEEIYSSHNLVCLYRQQFKIEHQFHQLLNKCTALEPIYLQLPKRIIGLIRILMIALQYVTLIKYRLHEKMKTKGKPYLNNLIPGNKGRKVFKPSTALLLRAFNNITLVILKDIKGKVNRRVVKLTEVQLNFLELLDLDPKIYYGIENNI